MVRSVPAWSTAEPRRAPGLTLLEITRVAMCPPWAPPPQQASLEVPSSQVTMTMPPLPYQLEASTAGRLLDSHLSLLGRPQSVLCPSSQRLGLTQMKGVAR